MNTGTGLGALAKTKAQASAGNRTVFSRLTSLYSLVSALNSLFRIINEHLS